MENGPIQPFPEVDRSTSRVRSIRTSWSDAVAAAGYGITQQRGGFSPGGEEIGAGEQVAAARSACRSWTWIGVGSLG
jgi:hypothetical protein